MRDHVYIYKTFHIHPAEKSFYSYSVVYGLYCRYTPSGIEYMGNISITGNGTTCERWDAGLSHYESLSYAVFPGATVTSSTDLGNKCRNYVESSKPKRLQPWCYTKTSWEYCTVPLCGQFFFLI